MKRHSSLIPLTHDHHHALAQARRLRLAAKEDGAERLRAARDFARFFQSDTLAHFREEEETLFPMVINEPEAESVLARVMLEHLRIHALTRALASEIEDAEVASETMTLVSETLERHIRLEEQTVFPLIERLLPEASLQAVVLEPRERRAQSGRLQVTKPGETGGPR